MRFAPEAPFSIVRQLILDRYPAVAAALQPQNIIRSTVPRSID
jgi:hypothetical protein